MAGTRRSTRQSASAAPKYAEPNSSASENETPKRSKAAQPTRRKRARDDAAEDAVNGEEGAAPPRKTAKRAPRQKPNAKPSPKDSASTSTSAPTGGAPSSLTPTDPSNRDAHGHQQIYWLLKAEPLPRYENGVNVSFSIDDLAACTEPEPWSGVRNPQACANMRAMREGDLGFFYHSNAKPSGVAGVLRVVREAEVDETAFDPKDAYYDKKSDREKPRWWCVGVEFVKKFGEVVDLARIKGCAGKGGELENMQLVKQSRLSVNRVRKEEWEFILGLAGEEVEGLEGGGKGQTKVDDAEAAATAE